jgi:hypothetical protein
MKNNLRKERFLKSPPQMKLYFICENCLKIVLKFAEDFLKILKL